MSMPQVMIDCGTAVAAPRIFETIRRESSLPLHTAIYTHGHVDHVMLQYTGKKFIHRYLI